MLGAILLARSARSAALVLVCAERGTELVCKGLWIFVLMRQRVRALLCCNLSVCPPRLSLGLKKDIIVQRRTRTAFTDEGQRISTMVYAAVHQYREVPALCEDGT